MHSSKSKVGAKAAKKPAPAIQSPLLSGFESLEQYRAPRQSVFPTLTSLRWMLFEYRRELLDADALRQHRGRLLLHPERTDHVVDQATKTAAVRRYEAIDAALRDDHCEVTLQSSPGERSTAMLACDDRAARAGKNSQK